MTDDELKEKMLAVHDATSINDAFLYTVGKLKGNMAKTFDELCKEKYGPAIVSDMEKENKVVDEMNEWAEACALQKQINHTTAANSIFLPTGAVITGVSQLGGTPIVEYHIPTTPWYVRLWRWVRS